MIQVKVGVGTFARHELMLKRMTTSLTSELTTKERAVLALASTGRSNREIAREMGITENTVRFHLKEIHSKLATDGDRSRLRTRRWFGASVLIGLRANLSMVGAWVGIAALSVGGFVAVRAAHDASAQNEAARQAPTICVTALLPTPQAGTQVETPGPTQERCFSTEQEKQAYYESLP